MLQCLWHSLWCSLYSFRWCSTSKHLVCVITIIYSNLDSQNKDPGDISIENRKIFAYMINENMTYKDCPKILACAEEFRHIKPKNEQAAKKL